MNPAYVVNVDGVVVEDGQFLLIERGEDEAHAAGVLAFPGGTMEVTPGAEDAIAATARRELREEVGVEVGAVEVVTSNVFASDDGETVLNVVARCERTGGEAHVRADEEVDAVRWLTLTGIEAAERAPAYVERYARAASGR